MRPGSVSQVWRRLTKQHKITAYLHDLRHTHASLMLMAGVHPKVVQERLGHALVHGWDITEATGQDATPTGARKRRACGPAIHTRRGPQRMPRPLQADHEAIDDAERHLREMGVPHDR